MAALGRSAGLVLTGGPTEAQALATAVRSRQWSGVRDVVPAASSVGIIGDAGTSMADVLELAASLPGAAGRRDGKRFEVAVCFDGPDLAGVAGAAGMSADALVGLLDGLVLEVGWIGFMPGFPYLLGLPPPLDSLPRLDRPRAAVPAGAFAVAGGYAGIYPTATPGGWNVLGRTSFGLFDPDSPPYATLSPGDSIELRADAALALALAPPEAPSPGGRPPLTVSGLARRLVVIDAGVLTTVQDDGRAGVAHLGVPPAGPADRQSHALANVAVGNAAGDAAIEITLSGPTLRLASATFVALVGDCPLWIDGREMPPAGVQLVDAGQEVRVGRLRSGARAYLGIAGGVELPHRLGSRSCDSVTAIPPGPLQAGDELALGQPGRPRGRWTLPTWAGTAVLRIELGPDAVDDGELARLWATEWTVHADSNRVGTRLSPSDGPAALAAPAAYRPVDSRATVTGAVQLPPDGCPVVLGPDHGTVGGYPVLGVLTQAGLSRAGQLRPGERVRFEPWRPGDPADDLVPASRLVSGWTATEAGGLG